MNNFFKILLGLFVACLLAFIFLFWKSTSPLDIVKHNLAAIKEDRLTAAYYDYTSKDFQNATSLENFRDFVQNHQEELTRYPIHLEEKSNASGKVFVIAEIENYPGPYPVIEYKMIEEGGKWKIKTIAVRPLFKADNTVEEALDSLLQSLKNRDLDTLYKDNVTNEFRKTTPREQIQEYLQQNPELFNYKNYEILDTITQDNGVIESLNIQSQGKNFDMLASFIIEEGKWKVNGIHLQSEEETLEFDEKELQTLIQKQLNTIRKGNIKDAYETYTSQEFKEATSYPNFEAFIQKSSLFSKNTGITFDKLTFEENVGTYTTTLTGEDKATGLAEYDLVDEEGQWKIVQIRIYSGTNAPFKLTKIEFGTETDEKGIVKKALENIEDPQAKLFANLYIEGGIIGKKVEIFLIHVDSNSSIPPLDMEVTYPGESLLTFSFTPPSEGWPKGTYEIKASSPDMAPITFPFHVKE